MGHALSGDILRDRKVTQLLHRVSRARCPLIPRNKARCSDKDAVMESGSSHQHELDVDMNVDLCWRGVETSCGSEKWIHIRIMFHIHMHWERHLALFRGLEATFRAA